MNIIETKNLCKTYRRFQKPEGIKGSIQSLWHRDYIEKQAIHNLNFVMEEGDFVGLIGPNGAGKTTLTKMLTGIIAPTSGQIQVMGYYPNDLKNDFKQQYAIVMGQKSQLFFELTTNDTLRLFKEIYGLEENIFRETKDFFVELFQVKDLMDVQVRTLSLGERMKMELILALLHNPKILFLDEPTIGLDAISSRQIRNFLREINKERGTSIILTSHYMEDIKSLCDRSVVINHGHKIYDGSTQELFSRYQKNKKITVIMGEEEKRVLLEKKLNCTEHIQVLETKNNRLILQAPKEMSGMVLRTIIESEPMDLTVEEDEIGTVVERIYQDKEEANA